MNYNEARFFSYTYSCLGLHFHYFATFFSDSKFSIFVRGGITWFCWFDDVGIQSRSNFVQLLFFVETQNMHTSSLSLFIFFLFLEFWWWLMMPCFVHVMMLIYICQQTHLIHMGVVLICVWEMLGQINIFEILISIFNM
jgi:hypothetical protein